MLLKATRFEILRNVQANGRLSLPLAEKPVRVCTLLNEKIFEESQLLVHNGTVFFEERIHDWDWNDGRLRYYTRIATEADVVIVYETEDLAPKRKISPA